MGTYCARLTADLFLLGHEKDFMMPDSGDTEDDVILTRRLDIWTTFRILLILILKELLVKFNLQNCS